MFDQSLKDNENLPKNSRTQIQPDSQLILIHMKQPLIPKVIQSFAQLRIARGVKGRHAVDTADDEEKCDDEQKIRADFDGFEMEKTQSIWVDCCVRPTLFKLMNK